MGISASFINTADLNMEFLSEKHYDGWRVKKQKRKTVFFSFLGKNSILLVAWHSDPLPLRRLVVARCSWSTEKKAQELIVTEGAKLASQTAFRLWHVAVAYGHRHVSYRTGKT